MTSCRRRKVFSAAAAALLLATCGLSLIATADVGVVTLDDGQTFEGEIKEAPDAVTVTSRGVAATFSRDRIVSVDFTPYAQRFKERLEALPDSDADGRVLLAREAFDRREYQLAMTAIDAVLATNPMHREARQMSTLIAHQIESEKTTGDATTQAADATSASSQPSHTLRRTRGLDEQQINRVRQLELRPSDRVHIQFRDNVRKRFIATQTGLDFRTFSARTDVDQALAIIEHGTADMVGDVIVTSDPNAIQRFGRRIHTAVLQGCATSACHGGDRAADLKLMTGTPDASTIITNFFLLASYTRGGQSNGGTVFAGRAVDMIDRANARESLLYQYALPRNLATVKHPQMRGWDGLVRSERDRLARDIIDWITIDLSPVRPDYDVQFTLRGATPAGPTTAPAQAEPTAR